MFLSATRNITKCNRDPCSQSTTHFIANSEMRCILYLSFSLPPLLFWPMISPTLFCSLFPCDIPNLDFGFYTWTDSGQTELGDAFSSTDTLLIAARMAEKFSHSICYCYFTSTICSYFWLSSPWNNISIYIQKCKKWSKPYVNLFGNSITFHNSIIIIRKNNCERKSHTIFGGNLELPVLEKCSISLHRRIGLSFS